MIDFNLDNYEGDQGELQPGLHVVSLKRVIFDGTSNSITFKFVAPVAGPEQSPLAYSFKMAKLDEKFRDAEINAANPKNKGIFAANIIYHILEHIIDKTKVVNFTRTSKDVTTGEVIETPASGNQAYALLCTFNTVEDLADGINQIIESNKNKTIRIKISQTLNQNNEPQIGFNQIKTPFIDHLTGNKLHWNPSIDIQNAPANPIAGALGGVNTPNYNLPSSQPILGLPPINS